eukprot:gene7572-8412_t
MSTKSLDSEKTSFTDLEGEDFVFVRNKSKTEDEKESFEVSEIMDDAVDLRGLNPEELIVVKNIKKLVKENALLKESLLKHNALIQEYCSELETMQKQQNLEQTATQNKLDQLHAENKHLKGLAIDYQTFKISTPTNSIPELELELRKHIMPALIEIARNVKKPPYFTVDKSLGYPIQESQDLLESISNDVIGLQHSIQERGVYTVTDSSLIDDLKADLSERMKDSESLKVLREKFDEIQELNEKLQTENGKCKKFIRQQQQKIEQLESEQPSVEIMQIASPQQSKAIENLKKELENKGNEMQKLQDENQELEEKVEALNAMCARKSQETSLHMKADLEEIGEIRETYEIAIEGLKDEIAAEKQKTLELSEMLKSHESHDETVKELALLNRRIEMMRKRENKDMDKINALCVERNTLSQENEDKLQIILNLKSTIESLEQEAANSSTVSASKGGSVSLETDQFEVVPKPQSSSLEMHQAAECKETIASLQEQVFQLQAELEGRAEQQHASYTQLEEDNQILVQQKHNLLAKIEEMSKVQEKLAEEQESNANLRKRLLEFEAQTVVYSRQKSADRDAVNNLRQELAVSREQMLAGQHELRELKKVVEEYQHVNEILESNFEKSKKDYQSTLNSLQAVKQQSANMEKQLKYFDEMKFGMSQRIGNLEDVCRNLEKQLAGKDAYISKLKEEVETVEILKEQMKLYESDFKMEREAREKQHNDILILRDDVHRHKLENSRLREEVTAAQRQEMAQLQRRYGVGVSNVGSIGIDGQHRQDVPGLYFRGGPGGGHPSEGGQGKYAPNDSFRSSVEAPPQDVDQNVQRLCPKCHVPFPDLDTLQIHVLECLDE